MAFITPKVGFKLGKSLYAGTGVLLANSLVPLGGDNFGLGITYGVVTVGSYDHNITVGSGYEFTNSDGSTEWHNKPMVVINGMTRLGKRFALVTENWIISMKHDPFVYRRNEQPYYEPYFSYAFRGMGERATVDFGFINTPSLFEEGWFIGVPYIDIVIRFGNYSDN